MVSSMDLNGKWKCQGFDGLHGDPEQYVGVDANERTFIDATVPGDAHLDLESAGIIPDCNVAMNAKAARWVEEEVWVYRRRFTAPEEALSKKTWLVFEGLDIAAQVYLNGELIGSHLNSFVPCRLDVTGKLPAGENVLAVRVEGGMYSVADKSGADYNPFFHYMATKRHWLRKSQCSYGWDWNPHLVNVGIWRPVRLEWADSVRIDSVAIFSELAADHKSADVTVRMFLDNVQAESASREARIHISEAGISEVREINLPPGVSQHEIVLTIQNPKLWWPRPYGDQPLYTVECSIVKDKQVLDKTSRRTGIRSVKINRDPHPVEGEYFIIEINGVPIFAQGGNWAPPDLLYARIDAARYRRLVDLAVGANFNALRIWGGGLYADHAFLDACDELGVMIWHDFIFACCPYPADDPEFLRNVRDEATHVSRDLSPHPSLVVWCGNNEVEWCCSGGVFDSRKVKPDYHLFHYELPRIVKNEDPSRPYWPSSPYTPGPLDPNDRTIGDQHPWDVSLGSKGADYWAYREDVSRFPNEGGVLGASSMATIRQFTPEDQRYLRSPAWEFHDNSTNYWLETSSLYYAFEYWFGKAADEVSFEDYVFYSGILQSEGLHEYIANFKRRMFSSSSAIFWMYNDSWPASHGWTIVDYYLRRKLSYHPARRAFAPVCIFPVVEDEKALIYGVNATPEDWKGTARFGLFSLAGGLPIDKAVEARLAANTSTILGEFSMEEWRRIGTENLGAFALLTDTNGRSISQNRLFVERFKDLRFAEPKISVERRGDKASFISPTFAWRVCLDLDGEAAVPDDVFDLLPGIPYEIDWPEDKPLPAVERCASPIR